MYQLNSSHITFHNIIQCYIATLQQEQNIIRQNQM